MVISVALTGPNPTIPVDAFTHLPSLKVILAARAMANSLIEKEMAAWRSCHATHSTAPTGSYDHPIDLEPAANDDEHLAMRNIVASIIIVLDGMPSSLTYDSIIDLATTHALLDATNALREFDQVLRNLPAGAPGISVNQTVSLETFKPSSPSLVADILSLRLDSWIKGGTIVAYLRCVSTYFFFGGFPVGRATDIEATEYPKGVAFFMPLETPLPKDPVEALYGVMNTVPAGQSGSHWLAFRLEISTARAYVYDSMCHAPPTSVRERLQELYKDVIKKQATASPSKRQVTFLVANGPRQLDGHNCGVFAAAWVAIAGPKGEYHVPANAFKDYTLNGIRAAMVHMCQQ